MSYRIKNSCYNCQHKDICYLLIKLSEDKEVWEFFKDKEYFTPYQIMAAEIYRKIEDSLPKICAKYKRARHSSGKGEHPGQESTVDKGHS